MSLAGVGVDIVQISRMAHVLERTPSFRERVFTEEERAYCDATAHPAEHYACRFAAREAVLKALGTGFSGGIRFDDVSVTHDRGGRPHALLVGRAAEMARDAGVVEVALSLSYTSEMAVANAVAVTAESRPKVDERPDPNAELAASFKEARSLIDELERVQTSQSGSVPEAETPDEGSRVGQSTEE
jgi:holo-[acyl-carrier protein] synthase